MRLLNPHGSDETVFLSLFDISNIFLLNPHGSDETDLGICIERIKESFLTHTVQMKRIKIPYMKEYLYFFLLNPHGSDETNGTKRVRAKCYIFLTHTVQMKPF